MLSNAATIRALTGSVSGIDCNYRDSRKLGFIFDKSPKLTKSPRVQSSPLGAVSRDPGADMCKVFQSYPASSAFCYGYNAFTQAVVDVSGKTALLAGEFFQTPSRGFSPFLLQFLAQAPMSVSNLFDGFPRKHFTIRGCGNVGDAQVNTQEAINVYGIRFFDIADGQQVKLAFTENQVTFPLAIQKHGGLALTTNKGDLLSSSHGPDRHMVRIPAQNAVIKGDAAQGPEDTFSFSVKFVGVSDLGNATHHDLSREAKFLFDRMVGQVVQSEFAKSFLFPSRFTNNVTRSIGQLHSFKQGGMLFWRRNHFDLGN